MHGADALRRHKGAVERASAAVSMAAAPLRAGRGEDNSQVKPFARRGLSWAVQSFITSRVSKPSSARARAIDNAQRWPPAFGGFGDGDDGVAHLAALAVKDTGQISDDGILEAPVMRAGKVAPALTRPGALSSAKRA